MASVILTDFDKSTVIVEGNVEITGAVFELWDARGKSPVASPTAKITMTDSDGAVYDQFYTAGKIEDFTPTEDGSELKVLGSRTRIHEQTNLAKFMRALFDAGFPAKAVTANIGFLVGTRGHVHTETIERDGGIKDTTLVVFDKITELPGGKKSPGKKGAATAADPEVQDAAVSVLMSAVINAGGSLPKKKLMVTVMKDEAYLGLTGNKAAVLKMLQSDEFLTKANGWEYEDGTIVVG